MDRSVFFDKACAVSLCLLIFAIPISSAVVESLFFVSLFFFIGRSWGRSNSFLEIIAQEKIAFLFLGALGLSLVHGRAFIDVGLHTLFSRWVEYVFLYIMISRTLISCSRIYWALRGLLAGLVLVIIDIFSQRYLHYEFIRHRGEIVYSNHIVVVTGPFRHNNDLAAYLVCALIAILCLVFSKEKIKPIAAAVFFLGVAILAHTYSRGAWGSFLLAFSLLAVLTRRYLFFAFCSFLTIFLVFKKGLIKTFLYKASTRLEFWDISFKMIKDHPLLGNGIGTYIQWCKSFKGFEGYAHNCYLQLWAETGALGLILFIGFVLSVLYGALSTYQKTNDIVLVVLPCAAMAFLIHSFFDTFFFSYQLNALFFILLGLMTAKRIIEK